MKKMFLGFILGLVVAGGIGVFAYTINAKQISYTPKDTTWKNTNGENITNVEDAINSLHQLNSHIERGTINVYFTQDNWLYDTITFEEEFSSIPDVFYKYDGGNSGGSVYLRNITTKSFQIGHTSFFGQNKNDTIEWIAINK